MSINASPRITDRYNALVCVQVHPDMHNKSTDKCAHIPGLNINTDLTILAHAFLSI